MMYQTILLQIQWLRMLTDMVKLAPSPYRKLFYALSPFTNNPGSASVAILRLCYSTPGLEHCHTISNPKEYTEKL